MSIAAGKVAEVLAMPEEDRAFLARQLIASLDDTVDADAETQWGAIIGRRWREIEEGKIVCRPWSKLFRRSATSFMRVVSHPEAEEELEAAALWYDQA